GRITETIGKYNPRTDPSYIEVDEKRALYWLRQGAMVSEGVEPLFRKAGILKKFADGAEGEGVVVIGDAQGSTIRPPKGKEAKAKAAEAEEKPAEEKPAEEKPVEAAAKAPEPEAAAEPAEPEAAAEAAEPEAEAEEEKQEAES
ncbi:MAG: 30S ribosomal protein S16, partial [Gemmatimonadales bacterium]